MIKYLGSKRRLVPVLTRICEAADARTKEPVTMPVRRITTAHIIRTSS